MAAFSFLKIKDIIYELKDKWAREKVAELLSDFQGLSHVASTGEYSDLLNKPTLFDGNYDSLTNKPTIPTKTSELDNDSGFSTFSASSFQILDFTILTESYAEYTLIEGESFSDYRFLWIEFRNSNGLLIDGLMIPRVIFRNKSSTAKAVFMQYVGSSSTFNLSIYYKSVNQIMAKSDNATYGISIYGIK